MLKSLRHLLPLVAAAAACAPAVASDINWNSTIGANNYTSAGAPHEIGEGFAVELGAFE